MNNSDVKQPKLPLPGYRNIKTALAVFLCLVIYAVTKREQASIALTSALICMETSPERSINSGVSRLVGTVIGAFFAVAMFSLRDLGMVNFIPWEVLSCLGLILFIYTINLLNLNTSLIIGGAVYIVIVLDGSITEPLMYTIGRVIDTGIGIFSAVFVNYFFFRPDHDRVLSQIKKYRKIKFNYELIHGKTFSVRQWLGGEGSQLYIYPEKARYADARFKWRISTSSSDQRVSIFRKFPKYKRHLMLLSGSANIVLNGDEENPITMKPFKTEVFDSGITTKMVGLNVDFKLMHSSDYEGELNPVFNNTKINIKKYNEADNFYTTQCVYALYDNLSLEVFIEENETFTICLEKGDMFLLENIQELEQDGIGKKAYVKIYTNEDLDGKELAILTSVREKGAAKAASKKSNSKK